MKPDIQRAIEILEETYTVARHDNDGTDECAKELCFALPLAITALEQQEESKVVSSTDGWYHFCDNCNKEVFKTDCYCHTCGSALAWEQQDKEPCEYCDIASKNKDVAHVDNTTMVGLPLNYCPMCGRSLTEVEHEN